MTTRSERFADKSLNDRHSRILKDLMMRSDNRRCADCKKKDPRWASWNIGIFVCIRCSGIHRSMGTHISKVKSADLDAWTAEQIENMVRWGNHKANVYWEHQLPPNFAPPETNMDQWIRAKYERRQFVAKGPMPNPDDIPLPEGVVPIQINGVAAAPKRVAPVIAMPQAAATNLVSIPQGSPLASPSVSQTQVGGAGSPAKPAATNVSSGADDLFEAFQSPPTTSPTPVTTVGGTSKAAAPTSPAQQPSIDLKANIMSLYATAAPNPPPLQQQQPFGAGFAAFQVPSNGTTPSQSFGGASAQPPVSLFSNAPSSGTQPLSSSATAVVQPASLAFAGLYGPGSSSPLRPSTPLMSSSTPPMTMSPTPLVPLSPMRNGSGASFASFSSASASLSNSVTSAASSPTMQTKSSVSDGIPNFGIPQFGSSATAAAAGSQSKKKSDDPFGAFSALSLGSGTGGAQGVAASQQQQPSPIGIAGAKPTAGFGGGSTASTSTTDFDLLGDFR